jgi:ATP-dependent protease ClpP protease subunit
MKNAKNEEPNNIFSNLMKQVQISSRDIVLKSYDVYLDDEITEPSNYRELISLLMNASEQDEINIFINSGGGNLDTACAIITALQCSQANVTAYLMGACHSAASMITMYCTQVHVFNSAYMMAHTASFGSVGNTSTVKSHTDFTVSQVEKLLDDAYEGFLSKDEIAKVKNGVEVWFDNEQIVTRMKSRLKLLAKRRDEADKIAAGELPKEVKPKRVKKEVKPVE